MGERDAEDVLDDVVVNVPEVGQQLAANLRVFRAYHQLTQAEVAERADLHRSHLAELERGEGNPRLRTLGGLAFAYNVDVADLLRRIQLPPLEDPDAD